MSVNAYQAYRQTQISTASQGELVLMLFDGAVRFGRQAEEHLTKKELEQAHFKLMRTQDIVHELNVSLNPQAGEITHNLQMLYDYIDGLLIAANVEKDSLKVREAVRLLSELRDTWEQVVHPAK